jgi:Holliday junction DNA helicase RuvA
MIASVCGRVLSVGAACAVVEVGGVGLTVQCTPGTAADLRVGETVRLATSLVVREDSLTLYGFADDDARDVFDVLQTTSGIGPRLAQAVLAVHGPAAVRRAVATEDLAALTAVPGIGPKGARRIVLELKDRLTPPAAAIAVSLNGNVPAWRDALRSALVGLGWSGREADEAVAAVGAQAEAAMALGEQPDVAALLRSSLQMLSRA